MAKNPLKLTKGQKAKRKGGMKKSQVPLTQGQEAEIRRRKHLKKVGVGGCLGGGRKAVTNRKRTVVIGVK